MRRYLFAGFLPALASLSAPLCAAEGTTGAAAPTVGAASGAPRNWPNWCSAWAW